MKTAGVDLVIQVLDLDGKPFLNGMGNLQKKPPLDAPKYLDA